MHAHFTFTINNLILLNVIFSKIQNEYYFSLQYGLISLCNTHIDLIMCFNLFRHKQYKL